MLFGLLQKIKRKFAVLSYDVSAIFVAWLSAFWLRYNLKVIPLYVLENSIWPFLVVLVTQVSAFYYFRVYRGVWRYTSFPDILRIIKAVSFTLVFSVITLYCLTLIRFVPRSILPLYGLFLTSLLLLSRGLARLKIDFKARQLISIESRQPVLIVGAGSAGERLARELLKYHPQRYELIGFIDDDDKKHGLDIHGAPILCDTKAIKEVIEHYKVKLIFVAIPSATKENLSQILSHCQHPLVNVRVLPKLHDVAKGRVRLDMLREISIEDLVGREEVILDRLHLASHIAGKCILVTGAGGSIGSELCRQIAKIGPSHLVLVDNSEYNLYKIHQELTNLDISFKLSFSLANVASASEIDALFAKHQPEIIYHAAAFKHVPLLEDEESKAIKNNVLGTKNLVDAAIKCNAHQFVLISTDKAVNPTNVMGATKRLAEKICYQANQFGNTAFLMVRFGNVLGSRGSVLPLFKEQISKGGPVTVTHPDITRYFMTIVEASSLILQASSYSKGQEVFVLDMGEPIKIVDLAKQLINLAAKDDSQEIEIKFTGLRPGEKLYEELFYQHETLIKTKHPKLLKSTLNLKEWQFEQTELAKLEHAVFNEDTKLCLNYLQKLVPEAKLSHLKTIETLSV